MQRPRCDVQVLQQELLGNANSPTPRYVRVLQQELLSLCYDEHASAILRASALPRASTCLGGKSRSRTPWKYRFSNKNSSPSAMMSRHLHCRGHPPAWVGDLGQEQLLGNTRSPTGGPVGEQVPQQGGGGGFGATEAHGGGFGANEAHKGAGFGATEVHARSGLALPGCREWPGLALLRCRGVQHTGIAVCSLESRSANCRH